MMKFKKIKNTNDTLQEFNNGKIITNQNDLIQVLSNNVDFSKQWYEQYYRLLSNVDQSIYIESPDEQDLPKLNFDRQIQFNLDLKNINKIHTHNLIVPQQVIFTTTIFDFLAQRPHYRTNNPIGLDVQYNNNYLSQKYFNIAGIQGKSEDFYKWLNNSFQHKQIVQHDDYRNSIFVVRKPPSTMKRYIRKDIKNIEIIIPPQDLFQVKIITKPTNKELSFQIKKKLTTYQKNYNTYYGTRDYDYYENNPNWNLPIDKISAFIYPSHKRLQYELLNSGQPLSIKKIGSIKDTFTEYSQYLTQDINQLLNYSNFPTNPFNPNTGDRDYYRQSQCFELNYSDNILNRLPNINFKLQDKLGYYNSLIWNYDLQQDYSTQIANNLPNENIFAGVGSYHKYSPIYQFKNYHKTNIFTMNYYQDSHESKYGLFWSVGKYKIKFNIKLQNNSNMDYGIDNLKIRFMPVNGIYDFQNIIVNENIHICKFNTLTKIRQMNHDNSYHRTAKKQHFKTLQNFEESQPTFIQPKIPEIYLKPKNNFEQYNFMFDRYGQFLTYRNDDQKAFNINGKTYIDIFSQIEGQMDMFEIQQGWLECQIVLDKKFQGNTLLSFMLFQTQDELISKVQDEVITLDLKNISINKID